MVLEGRCLHQANALNSQRQAFAHEPAKQVPMTIEKLWFVSDCVARENAKSTVLTIRMAQKDGKCRWYVEELIEHVSTLLSTFQRYVQSDAGEKPSETPPATRCPMLRTLRYKYEPCPQLSVSHNHPHSPRKLIGLLSDRQPWASKHSRWTRHPQSA
jgi:hypothetical protein